MSQGEESQPVDNKRCGFISIVGKPNVGKSTLLNHIIGQKLSITSRRPQTTRHQLLGIKTIDDAQFIFVDTPGMHQEQKKAINRYMNRAAKSALFDVDLIIFVIEKLKWTEADEWVLTQLDKLKTPVILVVNKVDQLTDKSLLMPHLQRLSEKRSFTEILPLSAKTGHNLDSLEKLLIEKIPTGQHHYAADQITNRSSRFLSSELIREKIIRQLGDELPYEMTVEIEDFKHQKRLKGDLITINAVIFVERIGQKAIIIGNKGSRIKMIGQDARKDMEQMFSTKVMLTLWVKIKSGWSDDNRALKSLGYIHVD